MPRPKILIIEDERPLARALAASLRREGFEVSIVHSGRAGLARARLVLPDLILLDLVLPDMAGLDVARSLRAAALTRSMPIVVITARTDENDQIVGLAMGADDYVTKPFRIRVLIERIRRLLDPERTRRARPRGSISESQGIVIDHYRHRALFRGRELELTPAEYRLLEALIRQPGRAFTRPELIDVALGTHAVVLDRTIDVHIKGLREELGEAARLIETVRGIGYRFRSPAEETS
jgi:two-component system phosphate regulon response regulator PhoB